MQRKLVLAVPLAFGVGLAVGWVAWDGGRVRTPAHRTLGPHPETIEVYRHPAPDRPEVTETLRVLSATHSGETLDLAEPRGEGRSTWTVRENRAGRVVAYTAEGVGVRP